MAGQDFPKDLSSADRIAPITRIGEDNKALPSAQPFSSLMKSGEPLNTGKTPMISPFDMMQSGHSPITQIATVDNLLSLAERAHGTLGDISNHLSTPKLKLRSSDRYLLKNKLNNTSASLRAVNAKLGGDASDEKNEEESPSKIQGPLGRFMSYLADGQQQLVSAQKKLQSLKAKGDSLSPADFLLIQTKLNTAQQELDFSSVLLSNAVSGLKMLMQVQL